MLGAATHRKGSAHREAMCQVVTAQNGEKRSAPGEIRTPDLRFRRAGLSPIARNGFLAGALAVAPQRQRPRTKKAAPPLDQSNAGCSLTARNSGGVA
jgi:hypothetical protein